MPDDIANTSPEIISAPPNRSDEPPPPSLAPREIWTFRDLAIFVAFLPLALLLSKLAVLVGYALMRPFAGWHAKAEAAQFNTIFLLVQQCVLYLFVLAFLVLLAWFLHRQPLWKSLGWQKPTPRLTALFLAAGVALAVGTSLVLWLLPDTQSFPLEELFNTRVAAIALSAFAVSFAPLMEEVVFRGLVFAVVEHSMGWRWAVVISAALFAGLHVPEYWHAWHHLMLIFVVGLVFSLARGLTGNLAPSVILHVGYNSVIVLGLFFSTQHFRAMGGFCLK
jgi:CAAX protease family protein